MSANNKPLPACGSTGSGNYGVHEQLNCITSPADGQMFPIASLLPTGSENAISARVLVDLVGCGNVRQLQHLISKERECGALILSTTSGGYFLPDAGTKGRNEIAAFVAALHARAINTLRAAKAARSALGVLDGQEEIEGL